jgi:hypothetical protein
VTSPTYDPTTPIGQIRLLINDVSATPLFTDAEITTYLTLGSGTGAGQVMRGAALALDTIASNEAMVSKVIKTQDLSTNGAQVSAELRARASALRTQADVADDFAFGGMQVVDFDQWAGVLEGELAELPWVWP